MREAVRFLAFEHGLVVEPSGAIGVGAGWPVLSENAGWAGGDRAWWS